MVTGQIEVRINKTFNLSGGGGGMVAHVRFKESSIVQICPMTVVHDCRAESRFATVHSL